MLRDLSRIWIVTFSYIFGLLTSLILIFGVTFIVATNITIKDVEEKTAFPTISDKYIGEYAEVYIRDMTMVEMFKEGKELADMGDSLTLNVLISRWDLILSETADVFLTEQVRDLPLNQVFSDEGFNLIMNSVYIGEFKGYKKVETENGITWYDPIKEANVKGINRVVSSLTLAEVLSGEFSFTQLLDDLTLGEALGYTFVDGIYYDSNGAEVTGITKVVSDCHINDVSSKFSSAELADILGYTEADGEYFDKNGKKVTGIMSVICDATVQTVPDKINSATFAEVLGYELGEDGCYYEGDKKITGVMSVIAECTVTSAPNKIENAKMGEIMGYSYNSETASWVDSNGAKVHILMNTISSKNISELNGLYKDLTIGDVIPEEERGTNAGYVSLLKSDVPLNEISGEVNRVFKENTMRDFVSCGAITFANDPDGTKAEEFVNSTSPMADMTMDQMLTFVFANKAAFDQLYTQQNQQQNEE